MRVETIKRQTRAAYGCLVAGQSLWAQAWVMAYTQKRLCSYSMQLVALYKGYVALPLN